MWFMLGKSDKQKPDTTRKIYLKNQTTEITLLEPR
jgi:hypothetical protein